MSDSIWKKEISFGRKPKAPKQPKQPKESKRQAPDPGLVAPAAPAQQQQSIWKKEISFGRKPKAPKQPKQAKQPKESKRSKRQAPDPGLVAPAAPAQQQQSIWKKEIGFGRKPKPAAPAELAPSAAPAAPAAPAVAPEAEAAEFSWPAGNAKERWWNKEIGGSRKAKPPEQRREQQPESWFERIVVAAPLPQSEAIEVAAPEALPEREPVAAGSPEPAPEAQEPRPAGEPAEGVAHPVSPSFARPEKLEAPLQRLVEAVAAEPPAEPWTAEPELPPAPLDDAEQAAPVDDEPAPAVASPPAATQQSFWKKEISLARKPKPAAAVAPAPEPAATAAAPAAQSLWKKEISLGRKKKPAAPPSEEAPKPKRARRRSFRLPALSLPGGGSAKLVGLKVGGSQIAAARVHNNGSAELLQLARMPLESGVVVGGELRDPQALATALRAFFARNKLPRRGVRLGVASSRIGVRIFEISGIEDERQFVNAVRFRAQEALPIPLDEAVLDYRVLDQHEDESGDLVRRVLLVVAHRDLVERYIEACRLAGLQLAGIDLEAFALLRSLAPPADRSGSALVAVAIGHERTTLAVSDGRVCEFTRVLEWGGWALNVALARVLDTSPNDVEYVKRNLSLVGAGSVANLSLEQTEAAVEAVRRGIEALARELVSSLQFYQAQPGSLGIGEVVLTGGTAQLAGLAEELQRLLGVSVRVGDPLRRLKVASSVAESDIGSLAIAIGLGIED